MLDKFKVLKTINNISTVGNFNKQIIQLKTFFNKTILFKAAKIKVAKFLVMLRKNSTQIIWAWIKNMSMVLVCYYFHSFVLNLIYIWAKLLRWKCDHSTNAKSIWTFTELWVETYLQYRCLIPRCVINYYL